MKLGIDAPISPRLLMAESILRFVKSGSFSRLSIIEEGMVEILEMEVLPWTKIRNKKISEAGFPKSSMVAAILRNGDIIVATGSFELKAGDVLIIFTLVSEIPTLEKLFKSSR
jgi:trk system potassium uptake protein TrkA